MLAPLFAMCAAGCVLETYVLRVYLPAWYVLGDGPFPLPKAYALVVLMCVCYATWNMLGLGFVVGGKRKDFVEAAKKKDDKHAEERFSHPQLYAEGLGADAIAFNCLQRGHQQGLETLTQFMVMGLIGGTVYPVSVGVTGLLWNFGRLQWAEGYAKSAGERYKGGPLTFFIWVGLVMNLVATLLVVVHFLGYQLPPYDLVGKATSLYASVVG